MRVTQNMINRNLTYALDGGYEQLSKLNTQLSTGQRVNTISDDVPAAEQILQLQRENSRLGVYENNLDAVNTSLSMATSSLTSVSENISRLKELAVQAATGTYTAADRQSMAEGVDSLLNSLVAQANVDNNGAYLFAGEAIRTVPYQTTCGPDGEIQAVTYQGAMTNTEVAVGPRTMADTNYVGTDVFQNGTSLFDTVIALRDAMRSNNVDEVNNLIGQLDDCAAGVRSSLGKLGERQSQLQTLRTATENYRQLNNQTISGKRDADVTALSVQYNSQMALLQMVMQVTAQAIQPTLASFLQ
jgi:flagellar hook-associated protein 3 FlgL